MFVFALLFLLPVGVLRVEARLRPACTYEESWVGGGKRFFIREEQEANKGEELRAAAAARTINTQMCGASTGVQAAQEQLENRFAEGSASWSLPLSLPH